MGRWRSGLIGLWLIAIVPGVSLAQVGAGAVSVVVADQAGAGAPGATVTLTALATNAARTAVSGAAGNAVFQGLAPGPYRLRVELSGFRPLVRDDHAPQDQPRCVRGRGAHRDRGSAENGGRHIGRDDGLPRGVFDPNTDVLRHFGLGSPLRATGCRESAESPGQ